MTIKKDKLDRINKRLKARALVAQTKKAPTYGIDPRKESWTELNKRLDAEEEAQEKARRNEPGMITLKKTVSFDSMFGWLNKIIKL